MLTAVRLAKYTEVIGISSQPALVSGQEVGMRISRPDDWARDYWIAFDRFRGLDRVQRVHGMLTGVDLDAKKVLVREADGTHRTEDYDALVIATGVTNGFWRRPDLHSSEEIGEGLRQVHDRIAMAESVVVVGGGAAAVSSAANIATVWPGKRVDLYYPGDRPLSLHHPRAWSRIRRRLNALGVGLHPGHRALVPDGFRCDQITPEPVQWSTGQPDTTADAVLWAIGRVVPNTDWLPSELLDEGGFVRVTSQLQVQGQPGVFAIGDVAATDPLRSSARNRADTLLARNIRAQFDGRPFRSFKPPSRRWGSVLGAQPDGLEVFAVNGRTFRFPPWSVNRILHPLITRRAIYRGIRDSSHRTTHSYPGNQPISRL
ncbi:FAD-dependent oxidoreductase [Streptomyces asoensis]|uniref:FAD-dependent oxidoreductase n=1 Tax=Streptomyces asoensis TaxID=249586 RepID=UPI0033E3131E